MPATEDLALAITTARAAGALVRERYGRVERLTKRAGAEAVTEADRASQRLIVSALRARFPADGIIGEENDAGDEITNLGPTQGERVWVIDPIDGTNNFVSGLGNFAVCIGLLDRGMPVAGVVYDVARDELYAGALGLGATRNGVPISALATPMSDRSLLMLTSNLLDGNGQLPRFVARWLSVSVWKLRMLGSAALEAVQVGAGVAHGAVTINGKLWDVAAPAAVLLAAGAKLTDFSGRDVFPYALGGYVGGTVPFLAAGPAAHAELLAEIQAHGW